MKRLWALVVALLAAVAACSAPVDTPAEDDHGPRRVRRYAGEPAGGLVGALPGRGRGDQVTVRPAAVTGHAQRRHLDDDRRHGDVRARHVTPLKAGRIT